VAILIKFNEMGIRKKEATKCIHIKLVSNIGTPVTKLIKKVSPTKPTICRNLKIGIHDTLRYYANKLILFTDYITVIECNSDKFFNIQYRTAQCD
jgi:hypothetical protein